MNDELSKLALKIINKSTEPLETKEILEEANKSQKRITRTKLFYRLMNLRGDSLIKGKFVGAGKGTWIWWRIKAF